MSKNLVRWVLGLALLAAVALALTFREHLNAAALESWVQAAGVAAPLPFMALYAEVTSPAPAKRVTG